MLCSGTVCVRSCVVKIDETIDMDREIPKSVRRAAMRRRTLIVAGTAAVAVGAVVAAMLLGRSGIKRSDVVMSTVWTGELETSVAASGRVVPAWEEIVNSPIDTRIIEVFRSSGDRVEEGTPLMALDLQAARVEYEQMSRQCDMLICQIEQMKLNNNTFLTDLEMRIKVKEMTVNRLAAELRNEEYLDSLGSGTGDNVRQARLAYDTGRLELEQLRKQLVNERRVKDADLQVKSLELQVSENSLGELRRTLVDAQVMSPRAGVLTYINNNIGERVPKGVQIAVVADQSRFKVECQMADSYADRLRHGGKVKVKAGRELLEGHVSNITPLSTGGVVSFIVELDNDSSAVLRSGLKTDVYVHGNVMDGVMCLKKGPYYTGPGEYELFVANDADDTLERRHVRLGDSGFDCVEVVSGLEPGDRVAVGDMSQYKQASRLVIKD